MGWIWPVGQSVCSSSKPIQNSLMSWCLDLHPGLLQKTALVTSVLPLLLQSPHYEHPCLNSHSSLCRNVTDPPPRPSGMVLILQGTM